MDARKITRILVIDDDANFRGALGAVLEADGFEVHQAASACEGIEKLSQSHFDVVLTDMIMPGGGQTIIEHVAELSPPTPLAVISSVPPPPDAEKRRVTWLVKPVTPEILRGFLRRHSGFEAPSR